MQMLERAMDSIAATPILPSLYGGFSGVAWTLEHLRGRLFDEGEEEDAGEEVATILVEHVYRGPWQGDYDLINGLVGYGIYALERLPRAGGLECLEGVAMRLAEIAESTPERGVTWKTSPDLLGPGERKNSPEGNYNLGLAHGVPGVVGLLARARSAGVDCGDLLERAVTWLLSRRLPEGFGSCFTYTEVPGGGRRNSSRLAWCYGDLGVAVALLMAARVCGNEEWKREGLEIADHAAKRTLDSSDVIDAGVCHGSGGVAHIFNRLYQETGDPLLKEAALTWLDLTMTSLRQGKGLGGYLMYVLDENSQLGWREDPGLLTGSVGVGLALLAAATPIEPEWDRCLLLSG